MMTSYWDDAEIRRVFTGCATLKDIIKQIETEFEARGEVICELHVNGVALDEDDEARFSSSPIAEIRDISVKSNRPAALIRAALESTIEFIPRLEASCLSTAEKFRGQDAQGAQASFEETLDGCQWLMDTFLHVRGAASGIGHPIGQIERWAEAERMASQVVKEIFEAYQKKDLVLVSDLLEYEITGVLAVWKEAATSEMKMRPCLSGPGVGTSKVDDGPAQDSMG